MRALFLAAALLVAGAVHADGRALKAFERGSALRIVEARDGRPFILAFWSVECVHCRTELEQLAALSGRHRSLDVVLVSTDTPAASPDILAVLGQYALPRAERWVFADDVVERLRFEVDPRWYGELPRTYLFGPGKRVESITGKLDPERVARWLRANGYRAD